MKLSLNSVEDVGQLKKLRKIGKYLLWALVGILAVGLIGAFTPTKWFYGKQADCTVPIYISNVNNFHAEIILPVSNKAYDWRQQLNLQQLGQGSDQYQYLSFGWGDSFRSAHSAISSFL